MTLSSSLQSSYSQNPPAALFGQTRLGSKETTMKNANASGSMPIGQAVVFKPSGATSDLDAATPANSTDKVAGILAFSDDYAPAWTDLQGQVHGQLDSTGVVVGALINVVREGWVYVKCHTGCVPGDRLFVCYAAAGTTYTAIGQLGNVAEASHSIDASAKGEWKSTATADTGAWLELHADNK
jgi:hypothetical protein